MGKSVLIVCTSNAKLGETDKTTGAWAEEIAAPYFTFKEAGCDVTMCSIKGGEVPIDQGSLSGDFKTAAVTKFLEDADCAALLKSTKALKDVTGDFDAIFVPGGHGTCWDLPGNQELAGVLSKQVSAGKVVSAVCHGPTGLVDAQVDGKSILAGKKVTGFTNTEEDAVGLTKVVPFLLEDKMKECGGVFESGPAWGVYAVRDGNIVTGQNPQSSEKCAQLVLEAMA